MKVGIDRIQRDRLSQRIDGRVVAGLAVGNGAEDEIDVWIVRVDLEDLLKVQLDLVDIVELRDPGQRRNQIVSARHDHFPLHSSKEVIVCSISINLRTGVFPPEPVIASVEEPDRCIG